MDLGPLFVVAQCRDDFSAENSSCAGDDCSWHIQELLTYRLNNNI